MNIQQLVNPMDSQLPPLNGMNSQQPLPSNNLSQYPLPNTMKSEHPPPTGMPLQRPLPHLHPGPPPVDPLRTTFSINLDTLATINALCQATLYAPSSPTTNSTNNANSVSSADALSLEAKRTLAKQVLGKIAFPQVPREVHWVVDNIAARGITAAGEVAHLKARLEERRLRLVMPGAFDAEKSKVNQAIWELDAPRGVSGWEACVGSVREWVGLMEEVEERERVKGLKMEVEEKTQEKTLEKMRKKAEARDIKETIEKDVEKNQEEISFIVSTEMASEMWTDSEDDWEGFEDVHSDDEGGKQGVLLDGKAVIFKNMTPESFE